MKSDLKFNWIWLW